MYGASKSEILLVNKATRLSYLVHGTAEEYLGRLPKEKSIKYPSVIIVNRSDANNIRRPVTIKKAIGRPPKVNVKTIIKLTDMLQHSASVSDACKYAGISRDTFYRYYRREQAFAERIDAARANQYKLLSFLTFH